MTTADLLLIDRVWLLLDNAKTPAEAIAALNDLVSEQKLWSDRCQVETAVRALLVIEHFKIRSRRAA